MSRPKSTEMRVGFKAWCVASALRDEAGRLTGETLWCYTEDLVPSDSDDQLATACDRVVVLPWALEERIATCPECLELIRLG